MNITKKGIDLMKEFEGLRLEAYQDIVGVWTIGYGNTYYEDGTKVKKGDKITKERTLDLYTYIMSMFSDQVKNAIVNTDRISDTQFSSMVYLAYNIGIGAFKGIMLLKNVNANPFDPTIPNEF